jgi:hypothetical protein
MVTVVALVAATVRVVEAPCAIVVGLAEIVAVGAGVAAGGAAAPAAVPVPQEVIASIAMIAVKEKITVVRDGEDKRGMRIMCRGTSPSSRNYPGTLVIPRMRMRSFRDAYRLSQTSYFYS